MISQDVATSLGMVAAGIVLAVAVNKVIEWRARRIVRKSENQFFDAEGKRVDPQAVARALKKQQERAASEASGPEVWFSGPEANEGKKDMNVIRHPFGGDDETDRDWWRAKGQR